MLVVVSPRPMLNTPARRSVAGIVLATPLLPALLALLACIPVPIGDPERSHVDPALTGAWIGGDDRKTGLLVFRPFDKRTWTLMALETKRQTDSPSGEAPAIAPLAPGPESLLKRMLEEDQDREKVELYKAWITPIGGRRFVCLEFLPDIDDERLFKPEFWIVARVDLRGDTLILTFPRDQAPWSKVKTSAEAEALLAAHGGAEWFFDEPATYARIPAVSYDEVKKVISHFGFGVN
jgi:hypothetical protein